MKKLLFLSFFTMLGISHGATQIYIPSTSTYQGNSSVINIASATIRYLNTSTFTATQNIGNLTVGNLTVSTISAVNIPNNAINVKNPPYNAKGDGVTDDINAIRRAILAVSSPTCGAVLFPRGNYSISDTIYWPSCVTLQGEDIYGTVIQAAVGFQSGHNIIAIRKPDGTNYNVNEPVRSQLRNFTVDGSSAPAGFTYGISMDLVQQGLIENVRVYNTPKSGIYTGGINYTNRQLYPTIRNVTLDSTGWNGGADQLGGGGIYGASYSRIICINSPGTCIDQVDSIAGTWTDVISTGSTGGHGQLWSDFGMQNSQITNCKLYGTSIHIVGDGSSAGVPLNNLVQGNYIENGASSAIMIHSENAGVWTIGNRIIGNTVNISTADAITVGYASGTVIMGNSLNSWSSGTGSTSFAIDIAGKGTIVANNSGQFGQYTVWLNEASGYGSGSTITNNNFPGASMNLDSTAPLSQVINYSNGTITYQGVQQFGNGSLPCTVNVKTVSSSSSGPAIDILEQDTPNPLQVRTNNGSFAGDIILSSCSRAATSAFNFQHDTAAGVTVHTINGNGDIYAAGDIDTVPFTDYSGTSTINGWASFTTKTLSFKKVGKLVYVDFDLRGTSSATASNFTLPYTASSSLGLTIGAIQYFDNGSASTTPGEYSLTNGTSTVNLYTNWNAGAWTGSGTKIIIGWFVYQAT